MPETIKCRQCSAELTAKRPWQRFCNTKCRNDFHRDLVGRKSARVSEELQEALAENAELRAEIERLKNGRS